MSINHNPKLSPILGLAGMGGGSGSLLTNTGDTAFWGQRTGVWTRGTYNTGSRSYTDGASRPSDGRIVVVSWSSSEQGVYSDDNGATWSNSSTPGESWRSCSYCTYYDEWIIVGDWSGSHFAYSSDGINWTSNNPGSGQFAIATDHNGKYVSCSYKNNVAYYSTNGGRNWTQITNPTGAAWGYDIQYGNGWWVCANRGSSTVMRSQDGINWTASTPLPSSSNWQGIDTDGKGHWVCVSRQGPVAYSTDNGATWSSANIANSTDDRHDISYYKGRWMTVNRNGTYGSSNPKTFYYSDDGINFTTVTPSAGSTSDTMQNVFYGGTGDGYWFAVGWWTDRFYRSPEGDGVAR